jgi:phenylalanyl-tRNA synthetase alpha chain
MADSKASASVGHPHPVSRVQDELVSIFEKLGFSVASGPELENGFHNFDALNVPKDHPSRDMQDTFWLKLPGSSIQNSAAGDAAPGCAAPFPPRRAAVGTLSSEDAAARSGARPLATNSESVAGPAAPFAGDPAEAPAELLRTHTSSVQIRYMRNLVAKCRAEGVPVPAFRIVAPGKVYRNEATDRTHEVQFHQLEGLVVGEGISLANLKWTLGKFAEGLFGSGTAVRLRPAFFPFVEPGVEVDASCVACGQKGCPTCKGTGWVEILGAGMVHPKVLSAVGIDPRRYSGFAFGMGVDRVAMMRYGVDDVRHFYSGDLRVVDQF